MKVALTAEQYLSSIVVEAVVQLSGALVADLDPDAPDPGPRVVPRDLRLWLARLRLLEGVPFAQLVADPLLLPTESIRFFHIDRGWTDALVEGALSVGTVTTADRAALETLYRVVRDETDEAERLVRLPGWEPGAAVPTGPTGPLSGFLLRSRMVSGWPALHVRAYARDNLRLTPKVNDGDVGEEHDDALGRLGLLRLERLAPAVLLAIFDGVPQVVHVEEPRAGVQFGVDETGDATNAGAEVTLRDPATGEHFADGRKVQAQFRRDAPGVMHLAATARLMKDEIRPTGPDLDAAEFAMQMLQFPYRAVFGDRTLTGGPALPPGAVFRPVIDIALLQERFTGGIQ